MMSDPEEFAAEVIQNLLHIDLDIRKKGLDQVQTHWNIKFREYLWKAIEQEKNKNFQAELVRFAISKLQEKSMRKMIRFIEKEQIHTKSIGYIVSSYFEYETPEIREAFIKSLLRHGGTYKFAINLIQTQFTQYLTHEETRQFVQDCINPEIAETYRLELICAIMNKYFIDTAFHNAVAGQIWDLIKSDAYTHYVVLENYFSSSSDMRPKIVKIRKKPDLLWNHWQWKIEEKGKFREPSQIESYYNEYRDLLEDTDLFLIESYEIKDERIQQSLVKIFGQLYIKEIPPGDKNRGITDTYLEKLYIVWDLIEKYNLYNTLMNLDQLDNHVLDQVFPKDKFDDEFPDSSFSSYLSAMQINPHDIVARTIAYLPRRLLLDYAVSDSETVALIATEVLQNKQIHVITGSEYFVGPPFQWVRFIKNAIQQVRKEYSPEYFGELTQLIFDLMNYIQDLSQHPFSVRFFEELAKLMKLIQSLEEFPYGTAMYFKFQSLLNRPHTVIPSNCLLTTKQQILLFMELFKTIQDSISFQSVKNIILMDDHEVLHTITDFLNDQIVDNDVDIDEIGEYIYLLSTNLAKSSNVRIRVKGVQMTSELSKFAPK